jgi:predicted transcriptional regulator
MEKEINPRSRWEIISDILRAISEERVGEKANKTRIMQEAYSDWSNFQKHFNFLAEHGFVGNSEDSKEGEGYYLTERGRNLMIRLGEVGEILEETFSYDR